MSMKKSLVFIMLLIFTFVLVDVKAEGEEQTTSAQAKCSYKEKNDLYKAASKVTASYEVLDLGEGKYSFKISIYNIVDGVSVMTKDGVLGGTEGLYEVIVPSDTDNGTYVFEDPNFETPTTYTFKVTSQKENCESKSKTITLVKPMRNNFFDLEECKYKSTEKSTYCQEWIKAPFKIGESKVLEKIREKRDSAGKITTTRCDNCDEGIRNVAFYEFVSQTKLIIAVGLAIGVVMDIFYIYLKIDTIRRSEL